MLCPRPWWHKSSAVEEVHPLRPPIVRLFEKDHGARSPQLSIAQRRSWKCKATNVSRLVSSPSMEAMAKPGTVGRCHPSRRGGWIEHERTHSGNVWRKHGSNVWVEQCDKQKNLRNRSHALAKPKMKLVGPQNRPGLSEAKASEKLRT